MRAWVSDGKETPYRPYVTLWVDAAGQYVYGQELFDHEPDFEEIAQNALDTMAHPCVGEPHRPGYIVVSDPELRVLLAHRLGPIGIKVYALAETTAVTAAVEALNENRGGPSPGVIGDASADTPFGQTTFGLTAPAPRW